MYNIEDIMSGAIIIYIFSAEIEADLSREESLLFHGKFRLRKAPKRLCHFSSSNKNRRNFFLFFFVSLLIIIFCYTTWLRSSPSAQSKEILEGI
jgi:hypothetical protein